MPRKNVANRRLMPLFDEVRGMGMPGLESAAEQEIQRLGMPGGRFTIELKANSSDELLPNGLEQVELLVSANPRPRTWHDFGGFPKALYEVQYPAPGDPQLATQVADLLNAAQLPARLETGRPSDHGVWVPLSLMYPEADIPVVQVSLPSQRGGKRLINVEFSWTAATGAAAPSPA